MITRSTEHLVCEHVSGCDWIVIFAGSSKMSAGVVRAARREYADKKFCRVFSLGKVCGDHIEMHDYSGGDVCAICGKSIV